VLQGLVSGRRDACCRPHRPAGMHAVERSGDQFPVSPVSASAGAPWRAMVRDLSTRTVEEAKD
jgi:hypothetical protein